MLSGVKAELAHIDGGTPTGLLRETSGTAVWQVRTFFDLNGTPIPVVPHEVQLATMIFRGQDARLQATLSALRTASLDVVMLRRALADRQAGGPGMRIPEAVRTLLSAHT